jgi:hypothetical protein
LQQEYGCDAMLASFLVRRVFCPAHQGRVGVADWLRMWYDDLILPKSTSASRVRAARREIPDVARLRQLLADIQVAKSLPEETRLPKKQPSPPAKDLLSVKPQPMLRRKSSWSDLEDDTMDFSMPLVFDDQFSTAVESSMDMDSTNNNNNNNNNNNHHYDTSSDSTVVSSPVEIKHAASALPLIHVEPASYEGGSFADSAFGSSSTVSSHMPSYEDEHETAHPVLIKAFAFEGRRFGFESRSTGGVLGYDTQEYDEDDGLVFSMD